MKNASVYAKILIVCTAFLVVLLAVFSLSLKGEIKPANETPQNIPYASDDAPDFFGVLLRFSGAQSVYLGFDKKENKTTVIMLENEAPEAAVNAYGYEADCVADADFDFLARFIDNFGGIDLTDNAGETFKYTGVQITEKLQKSNDINFKKTVVAKLLTAMKNKGVERSDLVLFLEKCSTNLSFPSIYYLHDTLNSALKMLSFVN